MRPILSLAALGLAFATATTSTSAQAASDEVNVYSYRQPELVAPLFDAFTAETGIKVNMVYLRKGMAERLKAEGGRSPADLVFTADISRLKAIVDTGLTRAVSSEVLDANIPEEFRDPDRRWFGLTARARIVYAAKDRVADGEITTYEDLMDAKWKGRICTRSGTNAYNVALVSAIIAHHGEEKAEAWLRGLKANLARKPQGNDRAQVRAIWAGECDIAIGNTYYMGLMLADPEQKPWADAVRIVFPRFEDGGTHLNISGVALTSSAPNKVNAIQLIEWLSSSEAQSIYAEINNEYPLKPGSTPSKLVQSWGAFEADTMSLRRLADLRPAAIKLVEKVDFDN